MRTVGASGVLARSSPTASGWPPSTVTRSASPPAPRTRSATHAAARSSSRGSPSPVETEGMRSQSSSSSRRCTAATLRSAAMTWTAPALEDTVAVVTGATRGVGKGVALVLGECGATVHVTGRTTVDEAAAEVTARGGRGAGHRLDHTDDDAVAAFFGGLERIDVLVANAWGGYEDYDREAFTAPFWEQPIERLDTMFRTGLRAQFTALRAAAPKLREGALVACTGFTSPTHYLGALPYDVIKAAVGRLVVAAAHELRPRGVAVVAVCPGFTRTERVVAAFAAGGARPPPETHSAEFAGRAIAMLAADPDRMALSGRGMQAAELAARYGFTDTDGRTIAPFELPDSLRLENV